MKILWLPTELILLEGSEMRQEPVVLDLRLHFISFSCETASMSPGIQYEKLLESAGSLHGRDTNQQLLLMPAALKVCPYCKEWIRCSLVSVCGGRLHQ